MKVYIITKVFQGSCSVKMTGKDLDRTVDFVTEYIKKLTENYDEELDSAEVEYFFNGAKAGQTVTLFLPNAEVEIGFHAEEVI